MIKKLDEDCSTKPINIKQVKEVHADNITEKIMECQNEHFSKLINQEESKEELETIQEIDQFQLLKDQEDESYI